MTAHLPPLANVIGFSAICAALWIGWLWHEYRTAPRRDDWTSSGDETHDPFADMAARADDEAARLAADLITEAERICEEAAS